MSGSNARHGKEHVLALIPDVTLRAGFMAVKSRAYILVLTDVRIIFVREQTSALRKLSAELSSAAKAAGKGRQAQFEASMAAYEALADQYAELAPAAILAKDSDNFAVERATVKKVKTRSNVGDKMEDRVTIKTTDKSYKMVLHHGMKPAKTALEAAGLI